MTTKEVEEHLHAKLNDLGAPNVEANTGRFLSLLERVSLISTPSQSATATSVSQSKSDSAAATSEEPKQEKPWILVEWKDCGLDRRQTVWQLRLSNGEFVSETTDPDEAKTLRKIVDSHNASLPQ